MKKTSVKRVLAAFLAALMVACSLPISVFAVTNLTIVENNLNSEYYSFTAHNNGNGDYVANVLKGMPNSKTLTINKGEEVNLELYVGYYTSTSYDASTLASATTGSWHYGSGSNYTLYQDKVFTISAGGITANATEGFGSYPHGDDNSTYTPAKNTEVYTKFELDTTSLVAGEYDLTLTYKYSFKKNKKATYETDKELKSLTFKLVITEKQADFTAIETFLNDNKNLYEKGLEKNEYTYSTLAAFNAAYKTLNDFYDGIDKDNYSQADLDANLGTKLTDATDAKAALKEAADYSVYDALIAAVKQQDMSAFTSDYIKSTDGVYGLIGTYGTNAVSTTFNTGVSEGVEETTPTDGTALSAYVNINGTVYKNATLGELDGYIRTIESALKTALTDETGSIRNEYTVTVNVYTNDAATPGTSDSKIKHFGDNYDITDFLDGAVTKIVVNGIEYPATTSYTVRIQSNTTIDVYKTDTNTLADKVAVEVQDIYGRSAQAFYVAKGTTIKLEGNKIYWSESTTDYHQANEFGSYTFLKWLVNGEAAGDTVKASEGMIIKPIYEIKSETPYVVTFNGAEVEGRRTKNIYYDTTVDIKPTSDTVAIAAKIGDAYYIVSYGSDTYTFFGCGNVALYSVYKQDDGYVIYGGVSVGDEMAAKIAAKEPFVWSVAINDTTSNKLTTYSTFSHGSKIIEAGTLYAINADYATEDKFTYGNTGVYSVKAENPNATSSQYWLGLKHGGRTVYTRAYVKYETTVNGNKVQVIDYGNIVTNA